MKQLKNYQLRRRNLDFSKPHLDYSDEFYELHFSQILVEIHKLVGELFCPPENSAPLKQSPWLRDYPESFNKYLELVAYPDPWSGKWDRILRDHSERGFVLQGILLRVLDNKVFKKLLFGADPKHAKALEYDDVAYLKAEGFRRTGHRAQANSMYLKSKGGLPPLFWEEVDKLTTSLVSMLLPVYILVDETPLWKRPPVEQLHQSLHDIVAYAGWLNVHMRLSPSIILIEWTKPGDNYRLVGQENLSQDLFEHSLQNAARHASRNPKLVSPPTWSNGWQARVKVSVAPEITRYTPERDEFRKGTAYYRVMEPHLVYYQGLDALGEEERLFISRAEYVQRLRKRTSLPYAPALAVLLIGLLLLWVLYAESGQKALQWCQENVPRHRSA